MLKCFGNLCKVAALMVIVNVSHAQHATPNQCDKIGTWLQVLGSGGPELDDGRASTSYLLWINGKSTLLIDTGAGSHLNFSKAGANFNDLTAVLFSHLHIDHSGDFPAYIKSSFFTNRRNDLLIFGPDGNQHLPATTEFINRLFSKQGVWPYLNRHLSGDHYSYQITGQDIKHDLAQVTSVFENDDFILSTIGVNHGPLPALAWKVYLKGAKRSIVFSGDTSAKSNRLTELAKNADHLVAHHAIKEDNYGVARQLHMPPSRIAQVAKQANVKNLVLSHRMKRTNKLTSEVIKEIKKSYHQHVMAADDMNCIKI